jgi:hypothetical protein
LFIPGLKKVQAQWLKELSRILVAFLRPSIGRTFDAQPCIAIFVNQ